MKSLTADIKSVNSPIVLFTHSGDGKQFNGCWLLKLTVSRWMFSAAEDLDLGGGGQSHNERFCGASALFTSLPRGQYPGLFVAVRHAVEGRLPLWVGS